jgi:cell division protein FtsA
LASENRDNEIVSIPGLRGRAKEISLKNLSKITHVVEIVFLRKSYGHEDPARN